MIVYRITNRLSGKSYIGMTAVSLADRWRQHQNSARRGVKTALHNAMRAHGPEAFEVAEVASLMPNMTREDLCALEKHIIAQEGSLSPGGYNMTEGGDGIPRGHKYAQASKLIGRKLSDETRAKMSAAHKGHVVTNETRSKIRAGHIGKPKGPMPEEGRQKIIASFTPERRAQMRAASMNKIPGNKGVPTTDEQRAKMKASWTPEKRDYFSNLVRDRRAKERRRA